MRVLHPGIVLSEVVVVPGGDDGAGGLELLIPRLVPEQIPLGLQHRHVPCVAIDVVADHHEPLGPCGDDGLPDRLGLILLSTGSEADTREDGVVGSPRSGAEQEPRETQDAWQQTCELHEDSSHRRDSTAADKPIHGRRSQR